MSDQEVAKAALSAALETARNRDAAKAAISMLFPRSKEMLGTELLDTGESEGRMRERRIRQPDFSRQYFRLTPDGDLWSKSQIEELMSLEPSAAFEAFRSRLNAAEPKERPKIRRLILERVEQALAERQDRAAWLIALMDDASILLGNEEWQSAALFESSNDDLVRIMLTQVMMALSAEERVALIQDAIDNAQDISLLCELMRSIAGDSNSEGAEYRPTSLGEDTLRLRDRLLDRVEEMAKAGELHRQVRPSDILWFWWGTGNQQAVIDYTSQLMASREGVRVLLDMPVSTVMSTAGNYEKVDRRSWSKIVNLSELEQHATDLASSEDEVDSRLAERFLQAMSRDKSSPY